MISPIITAVFAIVYLLTTIWLCRGVKLDARALCLGGVVCALTLVLASIRIPLPTGSNITCGSWIPLMLLALVYDYRLAMMTGWVCGILVMILIPGWQAVHWAQIFVQQLVCFSCLGYAYNISKEKENGDFHIFRDEIDEQRHNLLELINSIRKSIEDGCRGFVLFYQPIVDARTHVLRGSEALLRWEDPEYGLVPPNKFISIIEKQGIHLKISAWRLPRGAVR